MGRCGCCWRGSIWSGSGCCRPHPPSPPLPRGGGGGGGGGAFEGAGSLGGGGAGPAPTGGLVRYGLLGVVMGLAYLTNYPAVVLPVALLVLHLVTHRRRALRWQLLVGPATSAVVMFLVILPWLVVNGVWFGGPFWSQPFQRTLAGGSRQVEYVLVNGEAVKRNLPSSGDRLASLRERAIDLYGNVGFIAKQSLVLAPVLGGLFLLGLLLMLPMPAWVMSQDAEPSDGASANGDPPDNVPAGSSSARRLLPIA